MKLILLILISLPMVSFGDDLLDVLDDKKSEAELDLLPKQATFRYLVPQRTAEQNIFFEFLGQGQHQKALYQWVSAFEGDAFAKTGNGRALYGYLLFKNGLEVVGIEHLFLANPKKIHSELKGLWSGTLNRQHDLWEFTYLTWAPGWTDIFGLTAEVKVRARKFGEEPSSSTIDQWLRRTSPNSWERSWLQWNLVNALVLEGKDIKGAKLLRNLQAAKNNPISKNLMNLTAARLLYQNGFLKQSVDYYEKVTKNSDYWFEAQEELGWAFIRMGQPQNTLAKSQTLLVSDFAADVGPESFYLTSLANLKICDYSQVISDLKLFRQRFRKKTVALQKLEEKPLSSDSLKLVSLLKQGKVQSAKLGESSLNLPRFSTRDEQLLYLVLRSEKLSKESALAGKLYSQSLSEGTSLVGFQAKVEKFKRSVAKRARKSESLVFNYIQQMARDEISEINRVLKKMQIVEAEVVQQLAMSGRVIKDSSSKKKIKLGSTGSRSRDTLSFPFDGEIWFDELDNYKVDVAKGCQASSSKNM